MEIPQWSEALASIKSLKLRILIEQTLVAKRVICDHINSVDGILNVQIDKPLLLSVKQARQKYERYLENERLKKKLLSHKQRENVFSMR